VSPGQRLNIYVATKSEKLAVKSTPEKSTVAVARTKSADTSLVSDVKTVSVEKNTTAPSAENMKFAYHTVQPGDTLWKIAQRYEGMTVQQIKKINRLASNDLKVGTKLKVIINS
jgi:membrane-bound lytic murein transglycosylase D